jgi:hypothetical protein
VILRRADCAEEFDVDPVAMGSPLFRFINRNVRRSDNGGKTRGRQSVRNLLAEGGHGTVRDMHTEPPAIWWTPDVGL